MMNLKLSHRYAISLIESSLEKNTLDEVFKDMKFVLSVLEKSRQLYITLQSPVIRPEVKEKILIEIFSKKISKETMDFIKFVVDKKREDYLKSIAERFLELYDEQKGISRVTIKSAFSFDEDQKKTLQTSLEKLFKTKLISDYQVDESLIGGFIARVGDTLYDASIQHQLSLLKKEFLKGGITLN